MPYQRVRGFSSLLLGLAVAGVIGPGEAASPSSASYTMERVTVAGGAASSGAAFYDTRVTFAQEGPAGSVSVCNDGLGQGTGFWSVMGLAAVPVHLQVARDPLDPESVVLKWSGSSPSFEMYRAWLPFNVLDPVHLTTTTTDCELTDLPPQGPDIVYYLITPAGS